MFRVMIAPAWKRAMVSTIVTGIVFGCGGGGSTTAPSATPQGQPPQPSATVETTPSSVWTGIASGPFVVTDTDDPVQITLNVSSPGWAHHSVLDFDYVNKNDDGLDPPESVAATVIAQAWPAGTMFNVYGDPCRSSTTVPSTPVATPDEIAAAFAAHASSDATAPVDVIVGGFTGKAITIHVPITSAVPDASREGTSGDCEVTVAIRLASDDGEMAYGGAGRIDELLILDVDGSIVILDAFYTLETPVDLVEETRTLAGSATFDAR